MIGLTTFCFTLHSTNLTGRTVRITRNSVNLSAVPPKYHKFSDIFSKAKAEILALYCLYNLQIKLENRKKLPIRTIYLLSTVEQEALMSSSVKI